MDFTSQDRTLLSSSLRLAVYITTLKLPLPRLLESWDYRHVILAPSRVFKFENITGMGNIQDFFKKTHYLDISSVYT